jgi:hypothetical protein
MHSSGPLFKAESLVPIRESASLSGSSFLVLVLIRRAGDAIIPDDAFTMLSLNLLDPVQQPMAVFPAAGHNRTPDGTNPFNYGIINTAFHRP